MKSVQQTYIPGSEWLYIKLYTGHKTADKILSKEIAAVLREFRKRDIVEKWFFIRYSDPGFHLRIRFHLKKKEYTGEALSLLYSKLNRLVEERSIWKIQVDTYDRELERYGHTLIQEAEAFFYADSTCILSLIRKPDVLQNEEYRWMISLKLIDALFDDYGIDLLQRSRLMEQMSAAYKQEFGFNTYNSKQFNVKYREKKKLVEQVLKGQGETDFTTLFSPIRKRSRILRPIVKDLKKKLPQEKAVVSLESLIGSYLHMTLNRLFRSKNRKHELVIYDFMRRYYASELARTQITP
ncbi:MAG: thiopeptide-type bacteriocin biosynthesis protein [Tannerellaceae bacterium]|nr:thiopeptide-type bacteriocin biosynthesis protein [Tannerellaceae bacterium]